MSEQAKQQKLEKRRKEREKKKQALMQKGEKRLQERGSPDFGAQEADVLSIKQTVTQLVQSNNNLAGEIEKYRQVELFEKALNSHWMLTVLLRMVEQNGHAVLSLLALLNEKDVLTDKDVTAVEQHCATEEKIQALAKATQQKDMGLEDKPVGSPVDKGDIMIMQYRLMDEANSPVQVEDKDMGYEVGTGGLPETVDTGVIGMVQGETRLFDGVVFEKGKVKEGFEGRVMTMQVVCRGVKTQKKYKIPDMPPPVAAAAAVGE